MEFGVVTLITNGYEEFLKYDKFLILALIESDVEVYIRKKYGISLKSFCENHSFLNFQNLKIS